MSSKVVDEFVTRLWEMGWRFTVLDVLALGLASREKYLEMYSIYQEEQSDFGIKTVIEFLMESGTGSQ